MTESPIEAQVDRIRRLMHSFPTGIHVYPQYRVAAELLVASGEAEWVDVDARQQNPTSTGVIAPRR